MKIELFMKSEKADYSAKGIYFDGKITVLKGSKIRKHNNNEYKRISQISDYRNNPDFVDNNMIVLKDIVFNSPSTAAQFVADTSRNGLLYWRSADNKKLKDILRKGEGNE